jgi:hypothetical protein
MEIVGLLIVKVNEQDKPLYYKPITLYLDNTVKSVILAHTDILLKRGITLQDLFNNLSTRLLEHSKTQSMCLLQPFTLESNNKNKSSRNKRMLDRMKLSHLERVDIYEKCIA